MRALRVELERVRQELGKKNIDYASLKVDVDREELALQKKCKHLKADLEYQKQAVAKLNNELRPVQNEKMETTVLNPGSQNQQGHNQLADQAEAKTGTSDSPVWTSWSGTLKNITLWQTAVLYNI